MIAPGQGRVRSARQRCTGKAKTAIADRAEFAAGRSSSSNLQKRQLTARLRKNSKNRKRAVTSLSGISGARESLSTFVHSHAQNTQAY